MMKHWLGLPVLFTLIIVCCSYKLKFLEPEIKWMDWKEVQEAQKKEHRKVLVDVYTSWCGWCKQMDRTTYKNPEIIKYISDNFYAVKFDAETQETISLNGKEYKYIAEGVRGYNELAAQILNGQMGYPTSVFMEADFKAIFPVPGFKEAKEFETILNYVSSDSYKTSDWEKFASTFKGKVN
jgi:thioredoxin-related protein